MKLTLSAGIAGLAFLLAAASSSTSNASSVYTPRTARPFAGRAQKNAQPQARLRGFVTPGTCSTNAANSFVGIPAGSSVAGGSFSGVAAGYDSRVCDEFSAIGGGYENVVASGGTAFDSFIGAGEYDAITSSNAMIGAGYNNEASGTASFIGAGNGEYYNASGGTTALASFISGTDSFIGAGDLSSITGNGSFIGAGDFTYAETERGTVSGNQISGNDSFIGAGDQNSISGNEGFIGSGGVNSISQSASYATILGGNRNGVTGEYASILGGFGNAANGAYSIVAGGDGDTAGGILSFVAGYRADAVHNGSFVWSDYVSGSPTLKDTATNQFVARASGGVYLYSNEAATAGVSLSPGSGTWASVSDRNAKTDIGTLDDASVLAKVVALPVVTWRYKTEAGVRHVGPMAQDFYAAFGVGADDHHITSIDEDGIALAAIKALHRENASLRSRLALLERRMDALSRATARP